MLGAERGPSGSQGLAAELPNGGRSAGHPPAFTGVDLSAVLFAVPAGCIGGALGAELLTRPWRPGR